MSWSSNTWTKCQAKIKPTLAAEVILSVEGAFRALPHSREEPGRVVR